MIEVQKVPNKPEWKVKLERKVIGKITFTAGEAQPYQYLAGGTKKFGGERFERLEEVIASLK
jgi:hypothetical protein